MRRLYDFIPVTEADKPLLHTWRGLPHVAKWWGGDEDPFEEEIPENLSARDHKCNNAKTAPTRSTVSMP
ncbi:MAG TPA: hypothetical protein DEO85_13775 [Maritimibacter sp.]|nr:hypothetical protein [Maritimibacter sp.]